MTTLRTLRMTLAAGAASLLFAPASFAALNSYAENFEGLNAADGGALTGAGWLGFANVFDGGGNYLYGYGPFGAPNGGPGFSAIDSGQGGPDQGAQQLSVYSDYNNGDHGNGFLIEANVFQEQTVGAGDVGSTWNFSFDAKRGNIEGSTTALAFIKTLDPNAGFSLSNFITADMTAIDGMWARYTLSIAIDAGIVGHIFQIGFANTATNFEGSGIFYDNIDFRAVPVPGALLLFGSGIAGMLGWRRSRA